MSLRLFKGDSQSELIEMARLGGEAETVRKVVGEMFSRRVASLLSQLATIKPDAMDYAKLAGQAQILLQIQKDLDIQYAEGKEAAEQLRR